jgi:hypothetical protein
MFALDVVDLLRNRLQGKTNWQFPLAQAGDSEKDRERPSRSNQTEREKELSLALTRRKRAGLIPLARPRTVNGPRKQSFVGWDKL